MLFQQTAAGNPHTMRSSATSTSPTRKVSPAPVVMIALLVVGVGLGAPRAEEALPRSPLSGAVAVPPAPRDLADFLAEAEAAENLRESVRLQRAPAESALRWKEMIDKAERAFQSLFDKLRLEHTTFAEAAIRDLYDVDALMGHYESGIAEASQELSKQASNLDRSLQSLLTESERWHPRLTFARQREAPPEVLRRGEEVRRGLELAHQALRPLRDQLLLLLDRASRLHSQMEELHSELALRRSALREQLRTAAAEPLWRSSVSDLNVRGAGVGSALDSLRISFRAYWQQHGGRVAGLFAMVFIACFMLLRGARASVVEAAMGDARAMHAQLIFSNPLWASLLVALLAIAWLAPRGPAVFYDVVFLCMPIPAVISARSLRGPGLRLSLYSLAFALLLQPFRTALELMPDVDRWVLLGQVLLVGGTLLFDLRRGRFQRAFPTISPAVLNLLFGTILCGLFASGVANIAGFVGVSSILRDGLLGLLGFAMIYSLVVRTLYGLGVALIRTPLALRSRILSEYPQETLRIVHRVLAIGAGLLFLVSSSYTFHSADQFFAVLIQSLDTRVGVGEGLISIRTLLTAVAIGFATYFLTKILRLVLEVELFPRLYLPLGMPFAISAIARYAVAFIGFLLVTAALGIDLTKVTLLAGALGVGIGFGLQNIFNNFVSGLILLLEQPVHVEDVIEVGSLSGVIKRIGIRSSTVRTVQGAEVIVPNADLISREVINWTLSDRRRRLEIDVGVAYGTHVETVIGILEGVAHESKDTLNDPKPFAIFRGFGDSSLDFRLYAWIERFEDNLWVGSDLRRAILARFSEADIEIPYPQRDFHLRSGNVSAGNEVPDGARTPSSPSGSPVPRPEISGDRGEPIG